MSGLPRAVTTLSVGRMTWAEAQFCHNLLVEIHSLHGSGSSGVDFSFRVRTPKSQLCSEFAMNPSEAGERKQSPLRAQTRTM